MTNNSILIAIVCGLISALLFLAARSMAGMGAMLSMFTALPLFVSALGFGTLAGVISAAVATFAVSLYFGPLGALIVALATVAPALWIGHSAGLSRTDNGIEEWFPLSQILLRLALIAAVTTIAVGAMIGYTPEWASEQMAALLNDFAKMQSVSGETSFALSPEQISERASIMARLIPLMMPVSILMLLVMNLRLAERIVRSQGWMLRPRDDIPTQAQLPVYAVGIFLIAIAISFASSSIGLVGQAVSGAFLGVFVLVGLASIHFLTRGVPARSIILGLTWAALLFSVIMGPVLAAIGVAETMFRLRDRLTAGRSHP